jgi:hypothetical protein
VGLDFNDRGAGASAWSKAAGMLALLALSGHAHPVFAQATRGAIEGMVQDERGSILTDAAVWVRNIEKGLQRVLRTDGLGRYRAALLPAGGYQVEAEHPGFTAAKRGRLELGAAETLRVNLVLRRGARTDTADRPDAPAFEVDRRKPGTSIGSRLVETLPVSGRKFLDLGVMVAGATEFGERDSAATADIAGVNHFYTNMLVDGTDAYQAWTGFPRGKILVPFEFSQDAVQEIQVMNTGFPAEFGRAAGGLINVITRSGANDWHGNAFGYFSDSALNATPRFAVVEPDSRLGQFGGSGGGPLVRNKLFLFANYDQQLRGEPFSVTAGTVLSDFDSTLASISGPAERQRFLNAADTVRSLTGDFGRDLDQVSVLLRTDWHPVAGHTITGRVNYQDFTAANVPEHGFNIPIVTGLALSNQGRATVRNTSLTVQWDALLSPDTTNEARFQFAAGTERETANAAGPQIRIGSRNTGFSFGGGEVFPRNLDEDRWQWSDNLSLHRGRHVIKTGLDIQRIVDESLSLPFVNGAYQFNSLRDFASGRYQMYTQAAGIAEDRLVSPYYSAFVQDEIRLLPRLSLNLGVRYEFQGLDQPTVANPEFPQTGRIRQDRNNVAPRFGLTWSPWDRLTVRTGYGIYYAPLPLQVNSVAKTDNGVSRVVREFRRETPGAPMFPAVLPASSLEAAPGGDIIVFSPDYANPYIQHGAFEIEGEITLDFTLTAGWIATKGTRLRRNENINLFPPAPAFIEIRDTARNLFGPFPIESFAGAPRPFPYFDRIVEFKFDSNSNYHGFFVEANRRYALGFQVLANYTFSKLIEYEQAPGNQINCCTSQNPFNHQDERGVARRDQRHRFNLMGTWDLPSARTQRGLLHGLTSDWQLNSVVRIGTGRPYTATVSGAAGGDVNGDGVSGDRAPTFGRNTFTGPGYASVDGSLRRDFNLGEALRLGFIVEAFNLFNRANYLRPSFDYYNLVAVPGGPNRLEGPLPTFGLPFEATRSRQLQLAVRISF